MQNQSRFYIGSGATIAPKPIEPIIAIGREVGETKIHYTESAERRVAEADIHRNVQRLGDIEI